MTTIKTITPKTYQGKVTGHSIELSDGVSGYLDDKGSDKDLKTGEGVFYSLAVKQNKQGKDYNLLTLKRASSTSQPAQSPAPNIPKPINAPATGSIPEFKAQASLRAMEFVVNAYIADKIPWDQIKPNYLELRGYLWDGVDECNS